MADTTSYYNIRLSFEIAKLFDMCKLQSLYAASTTDMANLAMTDNERDFFDIVLKSAASKVYDAVSQDAKLSTDPIQYNVVDSATGRSMINYELFVHAEWDNGELFGTHTAAETALVNYCLKEWYKLRGSKVLFDVADANYTENIETVKNYLNRRKIAPKRVYRYLG